MGGSTYGLSMGTCVGRWVDVWSNGKCGWVRGVFGWVDRCLIALSEDGAGVGVGVFFFIVRLELSETASHKTNQRYPLY